jgi:hypothetical protein
MALVISSEFEGFILITPPSAFEFPENSEIMIAELLNFCYHFFTAMNSRGGMH